MTRRRIQLWVSTLLMILSLGLFALVAVLYFRGDDEGADPVAPTPVPGQNRAIDVLNALHAYDLEAEFGQQGTNVRSETLDGPGQTFLLENGTVYVFFYPDEATQEDALLDVTAADVDIQDITGDPVDIGNARLFANSNVAVLLVNGTEEEAEKVSEAIASLQ